MNNRLSNHALGLSFRLFRAAALASLFACSALTAGASEWKWSITPYIWSTNVGADVAIDDREMIDEEIAFLDLIEDVDAAAQVRFEGQRGAHGVMLDLFDVSLSENPALIDLPTGEAAYLSSTVGMTLVELAGIYDPAGDQQGIQFLYGTRILNDRAEFDLLIESSSSPPSEKHYETNDTVVDGLVGARYRRRFSPRWSAEASADFSTGGTELTWSAESAVGYSFGENGRYTLTGGYRYMTIDFDTEDRLDVDMTLSGFMAGLHISF